MTSTPTTSRPIVPTAAAARRGLVRAGIVSGLLAAAATAALAALARAADVPLTVDGATLPIYAFAQWTLVAAALGVVLALVLRVRRRFLVGAASLTALSLVPAVIAPDHTATRVVLVATHLVAAAVVVPWIAARLDGPTVPPA